MNSSEDLKSCTSNEYPGFQNQQEMQRFLNAAIVQCQSDSAFVLDKLGSHDNTGLSRLKEICSYPMSINVRSP